MIPREEKHVTGIGSKGKKKSQIIFSRSQGSRKDGPEPVPHLASSSEQANHSLGSKLETSITINYLCTSCVICYSVVCWNKKDSGLEFLDNREYQGLEQDLIPFGELQS